MLLLNYQPSTVKQKIQDYLVNNKNQKFFVKNFEGNFDNQNQTLIDIKIFNIRNSWIEHEHIHCSINQNKNYMGGYKILQAVYYFPFKKAIPFRERIYLINPNLFSSKRKLLFQMEILKNHEIKNFKKKKLFLNDLNYKKTLSRCIIFWGLNKNKINYKGKKGIFIGELLNGGCSIFSPITSEFIDVKDNLILSEYSLWVNDRGYDEQRIIKYGNPEKISYKMGRISNNSHLRSTISQIRKKYK